MKTRRVMGFGTFDAVHPGHLFYLKALKALGDELIIVIARDKNVKRIKGKAPYFEENERVKHIQETGIPDQVILGNDRDFLKVLRDYQPEVLGFGYDQRVKTDEITEKFPEIEMVRIDSFKPDKYKSSFIKNQLLN